VSLFLKKIVEQKKLEVAALKGQLSLLEMKRVARERKKISLKKGERRNIIAEIKRKSPSKGYLRETVDPPSLARKYVEGGAKAISVLTDRKYFGGSRKDLMGVVAVAGNIPVLRKDFIISEEQVYETLYMGADLILLIVRVLEKGKLKPFISLSKELGLMPLVEIRNREELFEALQCGAEIIGINNRDLESFKVDTTISRELLPLVPEGVTKVIESGLKEGKEMGELEELGADAFLVGETLVKSESPGRTLSTLIERK